MSVVVLGMDYPKSCAEFHAFLDDIGDYPMCQITGETRGYTFNVWARRMDNCPLRPLPDHHGRLIDGDELEDAFWKVNRSISAGYVEDMPTIIEKE